MGVYIRAKFEVSSMILTSFRQGGNFIPITSKRTPKSEKMLSGSQINANFLIIHSLSNLGVFK